ncbi:MAG: amidohydrolase family protein [Desulfobacterales bacterium]|nr:amidohydrolase family protein [Desulfobacterales bacterium]
MKINCHCHIFSPDCVPLEFRKRFFLDVKNPIDRLFHRLLRRILPEDSKLENLLDIIDMPISEIAQKLVDEMDEAGIDICTPLMMDMEYCEKFGGATKSFNDQIIETMATVEAINKKYNRIRMLPFIAVDPRREGMVTIVKDALRGGAFKGVKIYPVMGFTPDDRRLYPIYQYCVDNNIPITAHCENGGIPGLKDYYRLANPKYWAVVLQEFPELTLNLAHNDRTGSPWQTKIAQLIKACPNVYTDISYDIEMWFMPRRYFKDIKRMLGTAKIQDRLLYGTDWYMGRCLWTESSYLKWFLEYSKKIFWCRVEFTDQEIKRLTEDNPKRFLGL